MEASQISLPDNLGSEALAMFDGLLSRRKLFYAESRGEVVHHNGFQFEFRISSVLKNKPVMARDAPGRLGKGGPFVNPDPDFVVARVGQHHILKLNMHCVYRPAFVLHTKLFALQTDDLDCSDIAAGMAVMAKLELTLGPQMTIYNCGVDAGSSQGHKHMQVFPLPADLPLYPQKATSANDIESNIPGVPNQHFVLRLPSGITSAGVHKKLERLVAAAREAHARCGDGQAYNVVMTEEWLCVVPRRHAQRDGVGANGAGMVGLVWVRDEAERAGWDAFGLSDHLVYLGLPRKQENTRP